MEFVELDENRKDSKADERTDKIGDEIAEKVEDLYASVETKSAAGWNQFSGFLTNFQASIPDYLSQTRDKLEGLSLKEEREKNLLAEISSTTTKYIDELDQDLVDIGNYASSYWGKLNTFMKDVITVEEPDVDQTEVSQAEQQVLFNVPDEPVKRHALSIKESQLANLYQDKAIYLGKHDAPEYVHFSQNFTLPKDVETELQKGNLASLKESIVPSLVSENDFWCIFYFNKQLIEMEDEKRQAVLSNVQEEEEFNWDDDEEDVKADEADTPTDTAEEKDEGEWE